LKELIKKLLVDNGNFNCLHKVQKSRWRNMVQDTFRPFNWKIWYYWVSPKTMEILRSGARKTHKRQFYVCPYGNKESG
jgi:hypothetical protein